MLFGLSGSYSPGQFFSLGNVPVTLDLQVECCTSDPGFRISFYIGESSQGKYEYIFYLKMIAFSKTNFGLYIVWAFALINVADYISHRDVLLLA